MKENIKFLIFDSIILILIVASAFLLGRISVMDIKPNKEFSNLNISDIQGEYNTDTSVWASKQGKNYYPWWCPVIGTLKQENLISFDTEEDAMEHGLKKGNRC